MDLTDYTKATGMFLKAQDVKDKPEAVFVIKTEGEMVKSEKFGTTRLHLEGEFAGEPKIFDVSKTNARFIWDARHNWKAYATLKLRRNS